MTVEEKRKQDRERAAVYRRKRGIKLRHPAMPPEEKKRRHREAEMRRRRALGMALAYFTQRRRKSMRRNYETKHAIGKKRMRLVERSSRGIE